MRPIIPILALVSALWIFGGSYYMAKTSCLTAANTIEPFSVSDSELGFNTTSNQHFSFQLSGYEIVIEEDAGKSLNAVAQHLSENSNRQLSLNGFFLENESNDSSYDNLGLARAEALKTYLLNADPTLSDRVFTSGKQTASLLTINDKIIDGVSFYFEAYEPDLGVSTPDGQLSEVEIARSATAPVFALYGREEIKSIKLDINMQQQLDNMKSALDLNPGAYIMVTGHSSRSEDSATNQKTALGWAAKVRRFFRDNGIKSKEIKASSKGDSEPLVDQNAPDAASKNNRVSVEVIMPEN